MAEVVLETDAHCALLGGQAAIRSDIRSAEADVRCDVRGAEADIRRDVKDAEADIRYGLKDSEANIRYGTKDSEANVRRDVAEEACKGIDATKTAGWKVSDRVGTEADRIVAQDTAYYIAAAAQRADLERSLAEARARTDANFERMVAVAQLQAAEVKANTILDGDRTRSLLNEKWREDANRMLLERSQELALCHIDARRHHADMLNAQFASVHSQINAMNSQFTDQRQKLVNLGTMIASGQQANPTTVN